MRGPTRGSFLSARAYAVSNPDRVLLWKIESKDGETSPAHDVLVTKGREIWID
jgi:hypothetical protein